MKWVTRERPKIDRIACPWLIERFIEKQPEFLYVPADRVLTTAQETGAVPYDIPGVKFSHVGEKCSFDAFIAEYKLAASGLDRLADIVRGADTLAARPHAAVGRAVRHLARPQPCLPGRPRDAAPRHGDVRRALRLVPQPDGRDAQLAAQMSAA